jgi:hypothetical protein
MSGPDVPFHRCAAIAILLFYIHIDTSSPPLTYSQPLYSSAVFYLSNEIQTFGDLQVLID